MSDTKTRTVMVDGLPVECTDAAAIAIDKLQRQVTDSAKALADAKAAHTADLADRDAKLAKVEAERDDLKAKVLSDADLDAKVQKRADLISTAKAIADSDYTGKSEAEIRKAAVVAKLGDAAVKDKSDAYIEARFDILAEDAKKDPVNRALRDGATTRHAVNDNGYGEFVDSLDYRTRNKKEA